MTRVWYNTRMAVEERAYAKLNLTLDVLYRRQDGYHALDTIMQTVDLYDTVAVEKAKVVDVHVAGMQLPQDNTMYRAAMAYKKATGCGALVRCFKRIPAEAGMGGGSADAAAVLRALQKLHRMLDDRDLYRIALSVGADVPFMIRGGLQRAEGIGEVLTAFSGPKLYFVVAKPEMGVSTRALFEALPLILPRGSAYAAMAALGRGDMRALCPLIHNALEPAASELVPQIAAIKQRMLDAGAPAAAMTGSGSAVFALCETEEQAAGIETQLSDCAFVCRCQSV